MPWKGTPCKVEQAEDVQDEKLFDEISSFHNLTDVRESLLGGDTIIGLRAHEKVTADEKREALETTYEDPFEDLFKIMQQNIDELLNKEPPMA